MQEFSDLQIKDQIQSVLKGGDILLIIPPFASYNSSVIAPHLLQAVAREKGYAVDILYLNLLLASILDIEFAENLSLSRSFQYWSMMNERLFARSAYELPALGKSPELCSDQAFSISGNGSKHKSIDYDPQEPVALNRFYEAEAICKNFTDVVTTIAAALDYKIAGCTIRMGQINSGIALINGIKQKKTDIITLIGGTSCQGEMAEGVASLSSDIDFIFSGESEATFTNFLHDYSTGQLPPNRIIKGDLLTDLNSLPSIDYEDYYRQLDRFLGDDAPKETGLWYESSRGCWWGQKRKCVFCGFDKNAIAFRQKKADIVIQDLRTMHEKYPGAVAVMADSIMPFSYQKELLPVLASEEDDLYPEIHFYYIKANFKLKNLIELKKSKINKVTPGIESLSTNLLKLMNKGVATKDNLQLLRNSRSLGIDLYWFLLWGTPGDKEEYYLEMLELLPLIRHFQPPHKLLCIYLERFSKYFENPSLYKIEEMRPWEVYKMIFPDWADVDKLAYYFTGGYSSESLENDKLIKTFTAEIKRWQNVWKKTRLIMVPFGDQYIVNDNRLSYETTKNHILDEEKANDIMRYCVYEASKNQKWAIEEKLGVVVDSWYVPLVTASPELLTYFEDKS